MQPSSGNPAEVCDFGSNVTDAEKCMKEFIELRIICWKEREKRNGAQGEVADLRQST